MLRIALFILALGVLAWVATQGLSGGLSASGAGTGRQDPARQLDNVRQAADRIEQQQLERADGVLERTDEAR